jgi:polar amino acid transport system permease protein
VEPIQGILDFLPSLLQGAIVTLQVTLLSIVLALLLSFAAGFGRLSGYRLVRWCTAVYVEVFRGTSLLIQLFWLYFALPMLLDVRLSTMTVAILALGLNYGAYGSEVVRSSIRSVPQGQIEAAIALNMTPRQRMQRVILPQAWRMMLPAFSNLQIELLKGSSLVYLITLADLTYQGMILRSYDSSSTTEILTLLLIIYFVIAYLMTLGIRYLERRASVGRL